jgi:succinate-semialdehyde dehydrogenase/glutarate-semialdehyde dehydrogenase
MVQMLIGGEPVGSVAGETYEVRNPATGEVVGTAPKGTRRDVQQAIDAAEQAFGIWADTSAEDRGLALFDACARIKASAAEIAQLLTAEQGLGREHGPEALDYYLEPKGVVIAGLA